MGEAVGEDARTAVGEALGVDKWPVGDAQAVIVLRSGLAVPAAPPSSAGKPCGGEALGEGEAGSVACGEGVEAPGVPVPPGAGVSVH